MNGRTPGLAYGVFKCSDTREPKMVLVRIREALANIKVASEERCTPKNIEFIAFPLPEGIRTLAIGGETNLVAIVENMMRQGANYIIRASLPEAPNLKAAAEMADAFNCLYGGTELFDTENEQRATLVMDVFFKKDGTGSYVSKLRMDLGDRAPDVN